MYILHIRYMSTDMGITFEVFYVLLLTYILLQLIASTQFYSISHFITVIFISVICSFYCYHQTSPTNSKKGPESVPLPLLLSFYEYHRFIKQRILLCHKIPLKKLTMTHNVLSSYKHLYILHLHMAII